MAALADLLDKLRAEGELDSHGGFSLDPDKAREKLRQFQLADPRSYVLELVQCAVLMGAEKISFAIDTDDVRLDFDGELFSSTDFESVYSAFFSPGFDHAGLARRQLAIGLNAAMALNPSFIRVESGNALLLVRPGKPDEVSSLGEGDARPTGTHIHVRQRFRPGLAIQFLQNLKGTLPEETYLREYCTLARAVISLDGKRLSCGTAIDDAVVSREIYTPSCRGTAGLVPSESSWARLIKDGVWLIEHELTELPDGFVAQIDGPFLRKDASQADLVRDHNFDALLHDLEIIRWRLLRDLGARLEQPDELTVHQRTWARSLITSSLMSVRSLRSLESLAGSLLDLPLLFDVRSETELLPSVSLRELITRFGRGEDVLYGTRLAPELERGEEPPIVAALDEPTRDYLRTLFGERAKEGDRIIEEALTCMRNIAAWRARPMDPVLPDVAEAEAWMPLAREGVSGQVGIFEHRAQQRAAFLLIKDGCLLCVMQAEVGIPGLRAVLSADFEPGRLYDRVEKNAVFMTTLLAVLRALPKLMDRFAARPFPSESSRQYLKDYLRFVLADAPAEKFLRSCGYSTTEAARYGENSKPYQPSLPMGFVPEGPPASLKEHVEGYGRGFGSSLIARAPLFRSADRLPLSLNDIAKRILSTDRIWFVEEKQATGVACPEPPLLVLSTNDHDLLNLIFPAEGISNWQVEAECRAQEALFMEKREQPLKRSHLRLAEIERKTRDGIELWLAIPTAETEAGVLPSRPDSVRTRFLKRRRLLTTRELGLPWGSMFGVVNSDALTPSKEWDNVENDAQLAAVVTEIHRTAAFLVAKLCDEVTELEGAAATQARFYLFAAAPAILAGEAPAGHAPPDRERFRAAPIFRTLTGARVCLARIDEAFRKTGKIYFVTRSFDFDPGEERLLLHFEGPDSRVIETLYGREAMEDSNAWVDTELRRYAFEHRPQVEEVELNGEEMLVTTRIGLDGLCGEVGLARRRYQETDRASLTLLHDRRKVTTLDGSRTWIITAILDDANLPLTEACALDTDSPRIAELWSLCLSRVAELVGSLAEKWKELDRSEQRLAWPYLLDYLRNPWLPDAEGALSTGRRIEISGAVADLPGFRGSNDEPLSLNDLRLAQAELGYLRYLSEPRSGELLYPRRVFVVPTDFELHRLRRIFDDLRNGEEDWGIEQVAIERRDAAPPIPSPPETVLVRSSASHDRFELRVWLPLEPGDPLEVVMASDGRVVEHRSIVPELPCAGIVAGQAIAGRGWHGVNLVEEEQQQLASAVVRLYKDLAGRFPSLEAEVKPWARQLLADATLALHRADPPSGDVADQLMDLQKRLAVLPVLALEHGEGISLAQASAERRPALEQLGLLPPAPLPSFDELAVELLGEDAPPMRPPPATPVLPREQPLPETEQQEHPSSSHDSRAGAPSPPQPSTSTAETELIAALRSELAWLRARHSKLIADLTARVVGFDHDRADRIASVGRRQILLHARHPLVTDALAQWRSDPMVVTFLAAALFTALNRFHEAITDQEEQQFVHQLIHRHSRAGAGA